MEAIHFTDESLPGGAPITAWLWDFRDGSTSTEQNPSHSYFQGGWYDVRLAVTNPYGSDAKVRDHLAGVGLPVMAFPGVFVLSGLILLTCIGVRRRIR